MILHSRYKLLDSLKVDQYQTFRGFHVRLGHELMVHFQREPDEKKVQQLFDQLSKLDDEDRRLFLDAGEFDGQPYVVTWPLKDFDGLGKWLAERGERQKQPQAAPARPAGAHGPTPVAEVKPRGVPLAPAAPVAPTPVPAAPAPVTSPAPLPGEFTMFFGGKLGEEESAAPVAPSPAVPSPAPEPAPTPFAPAPTPVTPTPTPFAPAPALTSAAPAQPGAAPSPGEFTRYFGGHEAAAPASPTPTVPRAVASHHRADPFAPPPQAPTAGEFTRMFSEERPSQATPPPPPPAPAESGPGAFTMYFSQDKPSTPPPRAGSGSEPAIGELTRFLQQGEPPRSGPPAGGGLDSPFAPAAPPAAPSAQSGPGDYTLILGGRPGAPPMQAPAPPPQAQAPAFPVSGFPSAPSVPSAPSMPSAPSIPSGPSMPSGASMPSAPSVPSAPSMPSPPAPVQAAAPALKAGGDKTILIVAFSALALLAVLIVVYFLIRR